MRAALLAALFVAAPALAADEAAEVKLQDTTLDGLLKAVEAHKGKVAVAVKPLDGETPRTTYSPKGALTSEASEATSRDPFTFRSFAEGEVLCAVSDSLRSGWSVSFTIPESRN